MIKPGLLSIYSLVNDTTVNISVNVPAQVITLRAYRIEMSSAANALSAKKCFLEITPNVYDSFKMIDTVETRTLLPFFLDNAAVTLVHGMEQPITMSHHLPEKFRIRILGTDYALLANLTSFDCTFSHQLGHV